ncbi:MAG: AbrB/MazE/SpoVT family DNA-binding domain-containing protein [Aphanocapsa sp. GSE-SYN-MK-11-07L]|jgi:AbrB family looped-hinge helix DNA binding protein|nr:AbrB/MazE/SpoVT family DNA-binding domain-containing protein [Aphanocapsa sp. GSE-SYN-MK-11-07L]
MVSEPSQHPKLYVRGRLVLPASLRKRIGLQEGDRLVISVELDQSLRLVSLKRND